MDSSKAPLESFHDLPRFTARIGFLLLLTGIFLANFVARILLAPLLVTVEKDLHIGHGSAASLFLVISAGVCIGLLISGYIASRLTHRRTVILSSLLLGATLGVTSLSPSVGAMRASLFFLGLSAGFYFPSGIASITAHIRPTDWGKAIAVHELAPNVGFATAPLIAESLSRFLSWREVLGCWGIFAVAMGVLFTVCGRGGDFPGVAPHFLIYRGILRKPSFWFITVAFGLSVGASVGVYAVTPVYLVAERGMEQASANTLVAVSRIPGIAMALVAGWITDVIGAKRSIRVFLLGAGSATFLLGWAPNAWIPVAVFLQATSSVCFFPAGFAALAQIFPDTQRSLAVALSVPMAILLGAGVIPTTLGVLADRGSFTEGFTLVGVLLMLGAASAVFVRAGFEQNT